MRTVETKVYKFDELSDEAKDKVIEKLYYINVDYDWWEFTYEDAANIGLKINEFDIGRGSYCKGDFILGPLDVANLILNNHGCFTETFQTAKDYLVEYRRLVADQCQEEADFLCMPLRDEIDLEELKYNEVELDTDDIDDEFLKFLCEDYRIMLEREYEWLTSEESIIETIEASEYEFTEEGELW